MQKTGLQNKSTHTTEVDQETTGNYAFCSSLRKVRLEAFIFYLCNEAFEKTYNKIMKMMPFLPAIREMSV